MYIIVVLLATAVVANGQQSFCDQTPPQADSEDPSENKGIYKLSIVTKGNDSENIYLTDQTYVLNLLTNNQTRPFHWFMITVEDPDADSDDLKQRSTEVGSLKTLDTYRQSRYSERCFNSVESADNSDKYRIEVHWLSPKQNEKKQRVRLRATVAENAEAWYTGENLTIVLEKDNREPLDSPPVPPSPTCNLCSEARYEVQFLGRWSRLSHPRHYPSKPDDNGYSHMIGASHAYGYTLWQHGEKASEGLKLLANEANITLIEREIIDAMAQDSGTRTLIRGKRRHHPNMFEPSHSLFRVDRIHHLFSIVVAMKPSPDWFLGVSKFELCTNDGWLNQSEVPLYPWDAGTMDGISYESQPSMTLQQDTVDRVAVGSFNVESPFYQMNLIDLKPFASLRVKKLAEYELNGVDCSEDNEGNEEGDNKLEQTMNTEEAMEEPVVAESKLPKASHCVLSKWTEWSHCTPDAGNCGIGTQIRSRYQQEQKMYFDSYRSQENPDVTYESCQGSEDGTQIQSQQCYVDC